MSVRRKNIVYTSLDGFKLKKWLVKPIESLPKQKYEWVVETSIKLLLSRNSVELKAGEILKKYIPDIQEQVFFSINGHFYFLDYYIPKYKIAVEIDGSYHKKTKDYDVFRDKRFNEIGIRTIRILSKDVLNGKLIEKMKIKLKKK